MLFRSRFDWLLLLDPVAPQDPACWRERAGLSLLSGEEVPPLAAGQRIGSEGLKAEALAMDSQLLLLRLGRQPWLLVPDRQALHSLEALLATGDGHGAMGPVIRRQRTADRSEPFRWRPEAVRGVKPMEGNEGADPRIQPAGVWLGVAPRRRERRFLQDLSTNPVWLSGPPGDAAPLPRGWRASGASGSLSWARG